jgi:2-polyprenyl-6-methoxyphenol hydroxylase-like FAD-dependent oxidoreductase
MTQDVGQGLEDAIVLAESLRDHVDVVAARAAYERRRWLRAARITELSHATAVLAMIEHSTWCSARDLGLRTILPEVAREHLEWLLDGEASVRRTAQ